MSETLPDEIVHRMPVSIELPAGTGKTWTLAGCAQSIAASGGRTLVLTHTNAGVHAIRAKLATTETPSGHVQVSTITSFAFELARSYSRLAGVTVPEAPNWDDSTAYLDGACRVLENEHIRRVIAVSFTHLLVDEYQDCTQLHHRLVLSLKDIIPKTAVFGDRLQGIFGFKDPLVDWAADVESNFSALVADIRPHRWLSHNRDLGEWILGYRELLVPGNPINLSTNLPVGVAYASGGPDGRALWKAAAQARPKGETTVVITASENPAAARLTASRLPGFVVMEDIGGAFMMKHLKALSTLDDPHYAAWLADFLKCCFTGYGVIDKTVIQKLSKSHSILKLKRPTIPNTIVALETLRQKPSLEGLAMAMHAVQKSKEARLYADEAWRDTLTTIDRCAVDKSLTLVTELARVRDRLRHTGRSDRHRGICQGE